MALGVLIFVFAGVSSSRRRPILAEFAPVPNAHPVETPSHLATDAAAPKGEAGTLQEREVSAMPAACPEVGGPGGPEPTRFGDWERNGRCIDF
jgi:hypothetical protein